MALPSYDSVSMYLDMLHSWMAGRRNSLWQKVQHVVLRRSPFWRCLNILRAGLRHSTNSTSARLNQSTTSHREVHHSWYLSGRNLHGQPQGSEAPHVSVAAERGAGEKLNEKSREADHD